MLTRKSALCHRYLVFHPFVEQLPKPSSVSAIVCMRNLRNLHTIVAQSRDHATIVRNLNIGTQSQDSENAQCNLEIAQIPRLRGTYTLNL